MTQLFIGLMSGTSIDSIDAVLVDFSFKPLKLIAAHKEKISSELKRRVLDLCVPAADEINRLGSLDVEMGELFARACLNLLKKACITPNKITAIGSHGQTIRHAPLGKYPFTLQIGDPNIIAYLTGITTVADFRRRDLAADGQGAPLTPAFHQYIFHDSQHDVAIVNIGGMANITVLPRAKNAPIIGFDIGPGNVLLDAWIKKQRNLDYDRDGKWSSSGAVNRTLLHKLLRDPYFKLKPPKSTGREYFNLKWLRKHLKTRIKPQDVQATLLELTALTITDAVNLYAKKSQQIFICGGGAYNKYLFKRLQKLNFSRQVLSTRALGVDPILVESIAFAWFAKQSLARRPIDLTSVTGAKKSVILGGIYQ